MAGNETAEDQICLSLEAAGLAVLRPNTPAYQARETSFFSVAAQLGPRCIVQPRDAAEVALSVAILRASPHNWAVRGGGHTAWAGAANIGDDGVTLDLGRIASVAYAHDTKVARIGAGARWGDVYAALEAHGVTAPGGRTSTVGVGGYVLAGGNSFYSSTVGLACDNVVNLEVVLASGDIVNASSDTNPDLFRALKGGSSNFGIVTRVDMRTIDGFTLWGGLVTWPLTTTEQHIAAFVKWVDGIRDYPHGSAVALWVYTPATGSIAVSSAMHDTTATATRAAPAFDVFLDIAPQPTTASSTLRVDTHRNMTVELEEPVGYRQVWMTATGLNDARFMRRAVEAQAEFVAQWKADFGPDFYNYITFQALPTLLFEHSEARGGTVLGSSSMARLGRNAILFQMQHMVRTAGQEAAARARIAALHGALRAWGRAQGVDVAWEYLGYADRFQDPLGSYGADSVRLMREVAARYDPDGVFQTRVPGGFKISSVA